MSLFSIKNKKEEMFHHSHRDFDTQIGYFFLETEHSKAYKIIYMLSENIFLSNFKEYIVLLDFKKS